MPQLVLEVSRNEVGNPQQEPMYHKNILSGTAGLHLLRWAVKPRPRRLTAAPLGTSACDARGLGPIIDLGPL